MEKLLELRAGLEQQHYADALVLLREMEEISKDDKINQVRRFIILLLMHLIKQHSASKTTRSWNLSIYNSVKEIQWINKRYKSGGYYLTVKELQVIITETYPVAFKNAVPKAFEGIYEDEQLGQLVDRFQIEQQALKLILLQPPII
ncbi:MAG: DUF29 domain-containing protein [Thioploca sp.]|nr:DUF29 domain-containing protein [Thioploca sp.]